MKTIKVIANLLIIIGILILVLTFSRPIFQEIKYQVNQWQEVKYELGGGGAEVQRFKGAKVQEIVPLDRDFGIVIPKINANAKIFANIDPYSEREFLPVLKKGVAHAKGTAFPGEGSNIYLFAHSTDAFFNFQNYNAVFYLIGKLEKGDEIDIYYRQNLFKYSVTEKMVVATDDVKYLKKENQEILTLQTCYPPGTTLKRLIVRARLKDLQKVNL